MKPNERMARVLEDEKGRPQQTINDALFVSIAQILDEMDSRLKALEANYQTNQEGK